MTKTRNFLKLSIIAIVAVALSLFALAGCSSTSSSDTAASSEDKTIKVGASPTPHAEILNHVADALAEDGWTLEVVEYNDYVIPNTALEDGELDANYFQHITYLENFNEENGTHLTDVADIHFEPMRIYSSNLTDLSAIEDGATVVVPNDTTNEARALLLLEQEGLITLKDGVGIKATTLDIEENPHNLNIQEVEAAQVPRSIDDAAIIVVNCNYALSAGLSEDQVLAVESDSGTAAEAYVNVIAVKEGNENTEKTQALVKALQTDDVRNFIESEYEGAVVPLF